MAKLHLFRCSLGACINEYAEKTSLILSINERAQSLSLSPSPSFFLRSPLSLCSKYSFFFPSFLSFLLDWTSWRGLLRVLFKKFLFMQRFRLSIQKCSHDDTSTSQKQNIRTCSFAPLTMARLFRLPSSRRRRRRRRRRRGEEDNVRRNHFGRRQQ